MSSLETLHDIFSIFHDGTILGFQGDKHHLRLTIDCIYLAELIDPSFEVFYVELSEIDLLELEAWTMPVDQPCVIRTDYEEFFAEELEINAAELKNDRVFITCLQHNSNYKYSGGHLSITCKGVKLFDQNNRQLTIDQLDELCKKYWDRFGQH